MEENQEIAFYSHKAAQIRVPKTRQLFEEDKLLIWFKLIRLRGRGALARGVPITWDHKSIIGKNLWVPFAQFKKVLSDNDDDNKRSYESLFSEKLKSLGVPEVEHASIIEKIFRAVEAAVSTEDPVEVHVLDVRYRIEYRRQVRFNWIPASRSAIQGLEQVSVFDTYTLLSSCAICLEDFEQQPCTRLPCTHHFHVRCIVQSLEMNHLCPLCRYPMPTEEILNPAQLPTEENPTPTEQNLSPAQLPTEENPIPTEQNLSPAQPKRCLLRWLRRICCLTS